MGMVVSELAEQDREIHHHVWLTVMSSLLSRMTLIIANHYHKHQQNQNENNFISLFVFF